MSPPNAAFYVQWRSGAYTPSTEDINMKSKNEARSHIATLVGALALVGVAAVAAPASAEVREIKLATPEEAQSVCAKGGMGEWFIAYVIGKGGLAQWGPGYQCKQSSVAGSVSGVGNAVEAGGAVPTLATPQEALAFCKSGKMGQWDIAYVNGKDGLAQWGPGYQCKQSSVAPNVSGVGNAIVQ
jgi:hypothetical protein